MLDFIETLDEYPEWDDEGFKSACQEVDRQLAVLGEDALATNLCISSICNAYRNTALRHIIPVAPINDDACKKAYGEWCKKMHLVDITFTSWALPGRPSYAWEAWQVAWNLRQQEVEEKTDAMMAMSDSLGEIANEK